MSRELFNSVTIDIEHTLSNWRYRIGRDFQPLMEQVTGTGFTFTDEDGVWKFVFSIRRRDKWFKAARTIDAKPFEDEYELMREATNFGAEMMAEAVRKAFPEVARDEDAKRKEEGVNFDD